jgi:serine/threonine protein kinase
MFLTLNNDVKLGDFGLSLILNGSILRASKSFGTLIYNCPEMKKENLYSFKSDIYGSFFNSFLCFKLKYLQRSLGVSFYELSIFDLHFKAIDDISHKPYVDLPNVFNMIFNMILN